MTIVAGVNTPDIDFTLDPAGTISGTIYEADGVTPISHMNIDVNGAWIGNCSDENGHYTLYNAPLNVPLTLFSGGGNGCGSTQDYLQEWWQETPFDTDAIPITLTSGTPDMIGIDFTLELGGSVSGHIYESDGTAPITSNAWIDLEDPVTGWVGGTGINSDGTYTIHAVPAGDYRVRAEGNSLAVEYYNNAGTNGDNATIIMVAAGADTPNIDFSLDPAGTISAQFTRRTVSPRWRTCASTRRASGLAHVQTPMGTTRYTICP